MNEISTVVRVALTARPATATMIGRPAATTEPKVTSRMSAAAARPMPSEPMSPCSACCDALAAERDVQPAGGGGVGEVEHALAVLDRHVRRVDDVEPGVGDQGAAVRRRCCPGWRRGRRRRATCGTARDLGEQRGDVRRDGGVGDRPVGPHDDVDGVAGLRRELVLEQLLGGAGVRAGRRVVGLELAAERAGQHDGETQRGHPGQHRDAAGAGRSGRRAGRADRRRLTGTRAAGRCGPGRARGGQGRRVRHGRSSVAVSNVTPHNEHDAASLVKALHVCDAA